MGTFFQLGCRSVMVLCLGACGAEGLRAELGQEGTGDVCCGNDSAQGPDLFTSDYVTSVAGPQANGVPLASSVDESQPFSRIAACGSWNATQSPRVALCRTVTEKVDFQGYAMDVPRLYEARDEDGSVTSRLVYRASWELETYRYESGLLQRIDIDVGVNGTTDDVRRFEYDGYGQRVADILDSGNDGVVDVKTTYDYDENGHLIREVVWLLPEAGGGIGSIRTYQYDEAGQRVTQHWDEDADTLPDVTYTYEYCESGLMYQEKIYAPSHPVSRRIALTTFNGEGYADRREIFADLGEALVLENPWQSFAYDFSAPCSFTATPQ